MNDYISLLKKDLSQIIDLLIVNKIIDNSFNKLNLSIDYLSKSKQGDVSSNLLIILRKFLIKEKYNLKENLKYGGIIFGTYLNGKNIKDDYTFIHNGKQIYKIEHLLNEKDKNMRSQNLISDFLTH